QWANGETCRDLMEDKAWLKTLAFDAPAKIAEDEEPTVEQAYTVEVSGKRFDVKVIGPAFAGGGVNGAAPAAGAGRAAPKRGERKKSAGGGADELLSPLQGNMWKVLVEQGQTVEEGQLICIIEAMKMENEITAHKAGVIETLSVKEGEPIQSGAPIAVIKAAE
ncbi:MAG: acetyl-CoA/propionyl-CoA carboxylase, biotin carboxylase, biotin carboxyl carrier protein, partial [Solirubrobacteraceae bacterium]|nr:acetyl-CoA/propionyl-CoA carboxylase, biotin carboxylase, biotin carboxyl carrier protein [Solirubrobacteraceae bacterium]